MIEKWRNLPFSLRMHIVFFTIVMLLMTIIGTYLPLQASQANTTGIYADGTDPIPLCRTNPKCGLK